MGVALVIYLLTRNKSTPAIALSSDLKLASPIPATIKFSFGTILENLILDGRSLALFITLVMSLNYLIWAELFFLDIARAV